MHATITFIYQINTWVPHMWWINIRFTASIKQYQTFMKQQETKEINWINHFFVKSSNKKLEVPLGLRERERANERSLNTSCPHHCFEKKNYSEGSLIISQDMILDLKWCSFLPTDQIHIPMIIPVKMSFLIEWVWLCLWNVQCKILMHDFLPAICRNSSIGTLFVFSLSTQSPKPMCVLLWTWYFGLWVWLSEGSLLCSAGAAAFRGISEIWSMTALQWRPQLSCFFFPSLLPCEMVIKGKCLMPWAQSVNTTQLLRAMPYYQVSSTFLFC